jgi:hypothetical protein
MSIPSPTDTKDEKPTSGAGLTVTRLVPYKTTAGYWVFVPFGSQPTGATQGALVHGASYDTLVTTTTAGLRIARTAGGYLTCF